MLHRKRTLEYLRQPLVKPTIFELKEQLEIAKQLATEQQEYIEKLALSVGKARSAAKGNLIGLERVKSQNLIHILRYNSLNQKYEKLVDQLFTLKQSLKNLGVELTRKSMKELIEEYREKDSFITELEK